MSERPAGRTGTHVHRTPTDCPVCGDRLAVTRLGCGTCGTELAGLFAPCDYCALDERQSELLRVFLTSRGNLREVEKHLGVSYPTARARFNEVLRALGLAEPAEAEVAPDVPRPPTRDQILSEVASGALSPAEAQELLAGL